MSDSAIEALLKETRIAVLSTADASGRPHGSPVWFDYDGDQVRVLVDRCSVKAGNIEQNPRVSLTVDTREAPYRGVILSGVASLSGPDPRLRAALATRYLGERVGRAYSERTTAMDDSDRLVTIRIVARYSWDYSKGV
jgi:PPOX class probable F420-dependent enzyme